MLALRIAVRFLSSSKGQTALIAIGIGIAISVQVFVGILITSLQKDLLSAVTGSSPHITVTSAEENITFEDYQTMVTDLERINGVTVVAVSVDTNAFIVKGNRSEPVLVRGFDIDKSDKIYNINKAIYQGNGPSKGQVLIGRDLQETVQVTIGGSLTIVTAKGTNTTVTVSGFYDLQVSAVNKAWLITDLETSRSIFGYEDWITSIEIKVKDPFTADSIAKKVSATLNDPTLEVRNWKDQNKQLLSGLQSQSASSNLIQGFILVSVIIAIGSILAITVLQKSKEIGILKAMGIKDRDASLIFMFQGTLLGLLGSILGVILGIGLIVMFLTFAKGPDGEPVINLYLDFKFIFQSWAISMISAIVAGIAPARKSSSLSPIEVIRNG